MATKETEKVVRLVRNNIVQKKNVEECITLILMEEAYVMKDPFTEEKRFILLGANCASCEKCVCVSQECSLFYTKRFCLPCVKSNMHEFPMEIKQEVLKKKSSD